MSNNSDWIKWGIGLVMTFLVIILPFMGNAVVCNDKESRGRDAVLDDRLGILSSKMAKDVTEIKLSQMEMKKDIEYIVREIRSGR